MALTKEERNEVANLLREMAALANDAGQAARNEDSPVVAVARLVAAAQAKGNDAVRLLIASVIDND